MREIQIENKNISELSTAQILDYLKSRENKVDRHKLEEDLDKMPVFRSQEERIDNE